MHNLILPEQTAVRRRRSRIPLPQASARGQGLVEYALILVLVAVVVIVVAAVLGEQVQVVYCDVVLALGDGAPTIPACEAPRVTCTGLGNGETVGSLINVEAVVRDNKGVGTDNITQVQFFIDGNPRHTEYLYHYCLGGGGENGTGCQNYSTSWLSTGDHTLRAVATDVDGYTGECSISFHK
jgi:pilus assembly protein Flp/PilA